MLINDEISAAIYIGAYTNQMILGRYSPETEKLLVVNEYTSFTKAIQTDSGDHAIPPEAMQRVHNALHEMHEIARNEGASEYRIAAASSVRYVGNRSLLLLGCQKEFGVYPQILSPRDEARLNFIGAVSDELNYLPVIVAFVGYHRVLLAYGNAETIEGIREIEFGVGKVNAGFSLDKHGIGLFQGAPLRRFIRTNLRKEVSDLLMPWRMSLKITPQFLAVGPLAQTIYGLMEQDRSYNKLMGAMPLSRENLKKMIAKVGYMAPEHRGEMPGMDPSAVESIVGGMMILHEVMDSCEMEDFRVSSQGLCAGLLKTPPGLLATAKN